MRSKISDEPTFDGLQMTYSIGEMGEGIAPITSILKLDISVGVYNNKFIKIIFY